MFTKEGKTWNLAYVLSIMAALAIVPMYAMQRKGAAFEPSMRSSMQKHKGVEPFESMLFYECAIQSKMSPEQQQLALDKCALMTNNALHAAAWSGNYEGNVAWINKLIKEYHFPVNLLDYEGKTPLHKAVENSQLDAVRALMEAGADPLIPDKQGKTALDEAKNPEVEAYIRRYLTSPTKYQ